MRHKLFALFLFGSLLFLFLPSSHAQGERLTTVSRVGIEQEHPIVENIVGHIHLVTVEARHCQQYPKVAALQAVLKLSRVALPIDAAACARDKSTLFYAHTSRNLRTNAGGDWQASVMGNTAAPPATATFIALSNDATAPATSDTVVAAEITTNGLARAQATYAHTNGTASFTEQKVFTATGTQASQKAGLLNAASVGTLVFENTYTQVTVA